MRNRRWRAAVFIWCAVIGLGAAHGRAAQRAAGTTEQGVYSPAQAARGAQVYGQRCAQCHGDDLSGSDFGDGAPSLKRADFMVGRTLKDAFDRIKRGMPFDAPGSLTDEQYVDVVAYLLRENGHPAGTQDLTSSADVLGSLVVTRRATRP